MLKILKFVGGWMLGIAGYKLIIYDLVKTITKEQDLLVAGYIIPVLAWTIAYSVVAFHLLVLNRRNDD